MLVKLHHDHLIDATFHAAGETVEVADDVGHRFIKAGTAVAMLEPVKAVKHPEPEPEPLSPDEPETATLKPRSHHAAKRV